MRPGPRCRTRREEGRRPLHGRRGRRAGDPQERRDRRALRLGGRRPTRAPLERERHLRGARQGLHAADARRARGPARDVRRASRPRPRSRYLTSLGVTAVELLPVHHIADEQALVDRGLSNYWGYSSIGYLAPHAGYAATGTRGEQVREFKGMVKALHRAGIEVILDVVYNHTAEGNHLGPMLASFKGIDNAVLPAGARRPALLHGLHGHRQLAQPGPPVGAAADHGLAAVLRDGVPRRRLPLRPRVRARARAARGRPPLGLLRHHPPGPGAVPGEADRRAVGRRARAATRSATSRCSGRSGTGCTATRCATSGAGTRRWPSSRSRFTGSSDLYQCDGRRPFASINFVTAHDGFTLRDLVSYNDKHNEANLEDNRDGTDRQPLWNCGVEGPTDDPAVNALRARQQRNFLTTLLLSQGAPMLLGGDELGRTQGGNNNAYCQDNEISWFDWEPLGRAAAPARVHPAADRLPRGRAPRLPPHGVPARRGDDGLRRAGRLLVPARRPPDDRAQLVAWRHVHARRVPERCRDPDAHRGRARR